MKKFLLLVWVVPLITKAQGDCPAQYVCTGGNFTAVTDVTDELNSSNNGCLAVNEGTTSYWYQICAATAGTIQFEIAPSGSNNDYDWAVWNGSNCPPTTMPIRCSFAISLAGPGGDNTGVNSANNAPQTDNSEGAGGNQWTQDIVASAGQCYTICINNYGIGSDNFGLTFGGTATLACILPVELLYFNCTSNNKSIFVYFKTASQSNCKGFNILKSNDGVHYNQLVFIEGENNTPFANSYTYEDWEPFSGYNYYKLEEVDNNGNTRILATSICGIDVLSNHMNLYDLTGKLILSKRNIVKSQLQVSNGIYFLETINNNKRSVEKILINN